MNKLAYKVYEITCEKENGRRIVTVPLANTDNLVTLWEKDFDELTRLGAGLPWLWEGDCIYARVGRPREGKPYQYTNVNIARVILDTGKGEAVSYLDGNPTNLRRSNLVRRNGSSQYRTRELIVKGRRHEPAINRKHWS